MTDITWTPTTITLSKLKPWELERWSVMTGRTPVLLDGAP